MTACEYAATGRGAEGVDTERIVTEYHPFDLSDEAAQFARRTAIPRSRGAGDERDVDLHEARVSVLRRRDGGHAKAQRSVSADRCRRRPACSRGDAATLGRL